jgi:CrcB protein
VTWWEWVLVGAAGAAGAPLRFVVNRIVTERASGLFPFGTLVVNVSGSFVLGLITGLAMYHGLVGPARQIIGTGFLGAYTTFSAFSVETVSLLEDGRRAAAARNVAVSLLGATLAAAAGLALAAW